MAERDTFIDCIEAIGCDVSSEVKRKIRDLDKRAILPAGIKTPIKEGEHLLITIHDEVEEKCDIYYEPKEGNEGYKSLYYGKVGDAIEIFKNAVFNNKVLAFPKNSLNKCFLLNRYEQYIEAKNVLLLNREESKLRNYFVENYKFEKRINVEKLNTLETKAKNLIADTTEQVLEREDKVSDIKDVNYGLSLSEALAQVKSKITEHNNLCSEHEELLHRKNKFWGSFLITGLAFIVLVAVNIYLLVIGNSALNIALGVVSTVAFLGVLVSLLFNHQADLKRLKSKSQLVAAYEALPVYEKLKDFASLKDYIKSSLNKYVDKVVTYIKREQDIDTPDIDLASIHDTLAKYEYGFSFNEALIYYVKLNLFRQLGLNKYGYQPENLGITKEENKIKEPKYIAKKYQIILTILGSVLTLVNVLLRIMEVL